MHRLITRPGLMVRILCALALLCIGFAHKSPLVGNPIPIQELASYTLPDGTVPSLCLDGDHGKTKPDGHHASTGCEACRLSASVILTAPADSFGQPIILALDLELASTTDAVELRLRIPANSRPRAPPLPMPA